MKKYQIIYADPPWRYWEGGEKNQSQHYRTMTLEEITQLPVEDLADDDCVLFLWVTFPILDKVFDIAKKWGFRYSTQAFTWIKQNKKQNTLFWGCGGWTRANAELCLLFVKGKPKRQSADVHSVIESPVSSHSKKPAEARARIVELVGDLPRIELFARKPSMLFDAEGYDGWDVWGNEVDSDIELFDTAEGGE